MCWDYQLNKPAINKPIILVAFFPFFFSQWTILICFMVGLNWWMKPITKMTTLELRITRQSCWTKFKNFMLRALIRHEDPKIELPPGVEDTPTSSEATTVDDDNYHSDEIPLKSTKTRRDTHSVKYKDEQL